MTQPQTPEAPHPFAPPDEVPGIPSQFTPRLSEPSPAGPWTPPVEETTSRPGRQPWEEPAAGWWQDGAYPVPPTKQRPSPTGFAVAALALGIVGILMSWVPIVGLVMGVLAVTFGAVAIGRTSSLPARPDRGKALAGIITGVLAVMVSIAFGVLAVVAMDDSGDAPAVATEPVPDVSAEEVTEPSEQAPVEPVPDEPTGDVAYQESFDAGAGSFDVFVEEGMTAEYRDGGYLLSSPVPEKMAWSSVGIVASGVVDASANLETVQGGSEYAGVGLIVQPQEGEGYVFSLTGEGYAGISRVSAPGGELPLTEAPNHRVRGQVTLRLTVAVTSDGTELTGYVNGRQTVQYVDREGWNSFTLVGVVLLTDREPAILRADDVVIRSAD
jgi:hypothetical protein